ncbi:MAG: diacylglycerol/lipid kinase family protein, partial [Solirubrobacteraceae bacterium]
MTLAVIVNPFAGGGRAARELNGVEATLLRLGLEHHVERTSSLAHARELALAAAQAGETAVAFGGDGLIGAVADALRHTDGVLGVLPGGRGNDFVRMLGVPGS